MSSQAVPAAPTDGARRPRLTGQAVLDALAGRWRMAPVLIALLLIWAYFWWANPLFLSPRNLSNLSIQIVVTAIVALGLLFVLLIGEIDLSVAAVGAVAAAVAAGMAVNAGYGTLPSILAGLLVGAALGAAQGAVVTTFRAPSFIVTMGTSFALQGLLLDLLPAGSNLISLVGAPMGRIATLYLPLPASLALLGAAVALFAALQVQTYSQRRRAGLPHGWRSAALPILVLAAIGAGTVLVFDAYRGVPVLVAFLLGLLGLFAYLTRETRFGLHLYAVGANPEAARRAGISVPGVRLVAFTLTGTFAALGGMIAAGRVLGVSPDSASPTLLLEAIAAAVIGGVSLFGGRGSVWAALIGALVIGSVSNGMLLVDASTQTRLQVQGAILVAAVIVDALLTRRVSGAR